MWSHCGCAVSSIHGLRGIGWVHVALRRVAGWGVNGVRHGWVATWEAQIMPVA